MPVFKRLYDRALDWAAHPRAPWYLSALSFAESSFFPVPPDVMLIPMMLSRPQRVWRLAAICTLTSVAGGFVGYAIGSWAFHWIEPWLQESSYQGAFEAAILAFKQWGFWFILVAGFSPVPYKVFTISAGVAGMPLLPFLAGSAIGRGARFFLEALLIHLGGEQAAMKLRNWVDWIGWILVIVIIVAFLWIKLH